MTGTKDLVDEFKVAGVSAGVTHYAQISLGFLCECFEYGSSSFDRGRCAGGHDGEGTGGSTSGTARDGRIAETDPTGFKAFLNGLQE